MRCGPVFSRGLVYGLSGAVLAAGALVLFYYRDMSTMDPWYMLLLVAGVSGVSFTVGYVAGYISEIGLQPPSKDRE